MDGIGIDIGNRSFFIPYFQGQNYWFLLKSPKFNASFFVKVDALRVPCSTFRVLCSVLMIRYFD